MTYETFLNEFLGEFLKIQSFNQKIKFANQNLQKIGSGSGRIVYDIDGNKVFKLAKNTKGVAQNAEEGGAGRYHDTQDIVTIVYEYADDDSWLISEKAKKVNEKRIKELTGIPSLWDLNTYLRNMDSQDHGGRPIFSQDQSITELLDENEWVGTLTNFIHNYNQHVGDMGRPSTYGEVLRDGQPTIVLADYGLTSDVYNTHYSPKKKERYSMYEMYGFQDGNDDILSDIGNVGNEVRHGMWAIMPYGVGDGDGVINEEFVNFVNKRDKYPNKPISNLPYVVDEFHDCVNNLKEILNIVEDKKKFYKNLLKLQEYLIEQNAYDREPLQLEENEIGGNEIPSVQSDNTALDDVNYSNSLATAFAQKMRLPQPKYLGGGSYGKAYLLNNDTVLKITADVSEADAAVKTKLNQPKFIAKIFDIYKIIDTEKKLAFFVILQENINDKPLEKFRRLDDVITIIKPNGLDLGDIFGFMVKANKFNYENLVEVAKHLLTDNPESGISEIERKEAYEYVLGLLNIRRELISFNIKSNDYTNIKNLGYKDGVLKFYDIGGYTAQEPNLTKNDIIYLPEGDDILTEETLNEIMDQKIANKIANNMILINQFKNVRFLGKGQHGYAYDIGNDKVMKITTDMSEGIESLKIKGKHLKHLADVYAVYKIDPKIDLNIPESYVIIIEKLITDQPYFERIVNRLDTAFNTILSLDFNHIIDDYIYDEYDDKKDRIDKYMRTNPEDAKFYYGLLAIADEAHRNGIESGDYLNTSNLGYKKDGSLGFFDFGFGDLVGNPTDHPERIEMEEDSSSKFSTDDGIGQDDFPASDNNDSSAMVDNDLGANSGLNDDLSERVLSSMAGSSTVDVKDKCKLAGNGNTSTACNQGDINNLKIKPLKEDIDASEAYTEAGALNTVLSGKRDVGIIPIDKKIYDRLVKEKIEIIPVKMLTNKKMYGIIYRDKAKAQRLYQIIKSNDGFLKDKSPDEAREIGRLLGYNEASIEGYVKKHYPSDIPIIYDKSPEDFNDLDEGLGDKLFDKITTTDISKNDFENKFATEQNLENEDVVYNDGNTVIIKNPKSLSNIFGNIRGVIDREGNLYVEQRPNILHVDMLYILGNDLGLIENRQNWDNELPDNFVTVHRYLRSKIFLLGESNATMTPEDVRERQSKMLGDYWSKMPSTDIAKPIYQKYLDKAKQKNPLLTFINERIQDYEGESGVNLEESVLNENELILININEAKLMMKII